jgi:hypothetical protein
VIAEAIGLNNQAKLRPIEVHSNSVDAVLGERHRQSSSPNKPNKPALELGVGERERPAIKDRAQRPHSMLTSSCIGH